MTPEHEDDEPEPLLTQGRGHELLGRLSEKMPALQEPAEIYVIGGAAMMFEYDARRQTEDIDCVIRSYRPEVLEAAEQVAREEPGLGPDWLNEEADKFGSVPEGPDPDERTSYSGARIHVVSAGPERLLAMKLSSNRQKDAQDIGRLLKITGTKSLDDAKRLYSEAFGKKPMGEDAEKLVGALLTDPDRAATRPSETQMARTRNEPEQQRLIGTGGEPTR